MEFRNKNVMGIFHWLLIMGEKMVFCMEKNWLPDVEWNTRNNWIDGILPNTKSRVIFPVETWHGVGLPNSGKIEVAEIFLPREGALYLGKNGILAISEPNKKSVTDAQWSKKGIYLWIDPDNWGGYSVAAPHTERIPCDYDTVVFPDKNHILSLSLPQVDLHVQAIKVKGENDTLNRWEWTRLATGPLNIARNHLTVTYASAMQLQLCNDCTCHGGTDKTVSEEVCSHMWQADKCVDNVCESPLAVEGHCCDYCGGRVGLPATASLKKIRTEANRALEKYRDVVSWHIRRTWTGNNEVLIAEKGTYNGIYSEEAVDVLAKALSEAGLDVLENISTGAALTDSPMSIILGPVLGIPFFLVLVMLAVFPYFGYSYSQLISGWREAWSSITISDRTDSSPSPFSFARFQNVAEGDVRLVNEDTLPAYEEAQDDEEDIDSEIDRPSSSRSKRFENPLYRSDRKIIKSDDITTIKEEKFIDIDDPVSLTVLESRMFDEQAGKDEKPDHDSL